MCYDAGSSAMGRRVMTRIVFALAALAALTIGAAAQEPTCSNSGNIYQVGDVACITPCHSQQTRLARCERQVSGATWTYLSESCPSATLLEPPARLSRLGS
jgi:hypothetical protein